VAARSGGPLLLVTANAIPAATANELARLKPGRMVVLGGAGVVSEAVRAALAQYATTSVVERVAGADRFATAAAISASLFVPGVPVAYIATGSNFPDALAGVPLGALSGGPILLSGSDGLPAATAAELSRLRPGRIVILGGPSVVSEAVADRLKAYTGGSVGRLAGADRFATSVAISKAGFSSAATVFLATGANFPDALAGGPVAGVVGGPLLLVGRDSVPSVVRQGLQRLAPSTVVILGGPGVVGEAVVAEVRALLP
jgi:putative cell wall-binding protein